MHLSPPFKSFFSSLSLRHPYYVCGALLLSLMPMTGHSTEPPSDATILTKALAPIKGSLVNRPLAKIHGETITLFDVLRRMEIDSKMDLSSFPKSEKECQNLYKTHWATHWPDALREMIQSKLLLLDAEEKKVALAEGELREEMEERFGAHFLEEITKRGLSLEEVEERLSEDLLSRRMLWFNVYAKAQQKVSPGSIKQAYQEYIKEFTPKEEWTYRLLTLRPSKDKGINESEEPIESPQEKMNDEMVSRIHEVIASVPSSFDELSQKIEDLYPDTLTTHLSKECTLPHTQISEQYREVLETLKEGAFSPPIVQKNSKGEEVCRIFQLKEHSIESSPLFKESISKIEDALFQQISQDHHIAYMKKLQASFAVELLAENHASD